jgi:hypothetical protein
LWLYRKHHKAKSLALLFGSLIAVDVLILGSWFGLDKLAARLETTDATRRAYLCFSKQP